MTDRLDAVQDHWHNLHLALVARTGWSNTGRETVVDCWRKLSIARDT
jgi:hypothetical protein